MTTLNAPQRRAGARRSLAAIAVAAMAFLTGCGGGGNPLGNPSNVDNPAAVGGQKLSFAYFQKCINPIFLAQLQINVNGVISTNTCAGSGCHSDATGTGGAFRIVPGAVALDVRNPANTPDVIRQSDMYKNFYSAQGEVVFGSPTTSRLVAKPRLMGVLHGGGLIFENDQDPNVRLIQYWITHPMPAGQDEFSAAGNGLFTPADPISGTCNTQ